MSHKYVTRKNFEDWKDMFDNVEFYSEPDYQKSWVRFDATLPNGVKFQFKATAILHNTDGRFYGRYDDWNEVKIDKYGLNNFSFFGKGARSNETWSEAEELFKILAES